MKRRSTAEEKELTDRARLLSWWKKFHAEEKAAVLNGPHGVALAELFRMIKNIEHIRPSQLVGLASAIDWAAIDTNSKLVTLHELNNSITKLREARGLDPIDDALSHEPLRVFQVIRGIVMNQFPASAGESPPEPIRQNSGEVP
jgi:hypothetical protein